MEQFMDKSLSFVIVITHTRIVFGEEVLSSWPTVGVLSPNPRWAIQIGRHNICHWLFITFQRNRYGLHCVHSKQLSPWLYWLTRLPHRFFRRNPVSTAAWPSMNCGKPTFRPPNWRKKIVKITPEDTKYSFDIVTSLWLQLIVTKFSIILRTALSYRSGENQYNWAMEYANDFRYLTASALCWTFSIISSLTVPW